jgi:hypothetical protein
MAALAVTAMVVRAGAFMLFVIRYQATRNAGYLVLMAFVIVPVLLAYAVRGALGNRAAVAGPAVDLTTVGLAALGAWMVERGASRAGRVRG